MLNPDPVAGGPGRSADEPQTPAVEVGKRVRTIRSLKRMTLKRVAEDAQLSESFLSQLERGQANASIPSMQRIAAALHTTVAELFEPDGPAATRLTRKRERHGLRLGGLGTKYLLTPTPLGNLEAFIGEFEPGGSTGDELYAHGASDELFLVLRGRFVLQIEEETFTLSQGDCITYNSSQPHRATNVDTRSRGEALWVLSPPSY